MKFTTNVSLIICLLLACYISTSESSECYKNVIKDVLDDSIYEVFNDCYYNRSFCMGDRVGCVQRQDCYMLVTAKHVDNCLDWYEPEFQTLINIYMRESVQLRSKKKALLWVSVNVNGTEIYKKNETYAITSLSSYINQIANNQTRKEILIWNHEKLAIVNKTSGLATYIDRKIGYDYSDYTYTHYGYYLSNYQLKFASFTYNFIKDLDVYYDIIGSVTKLIDPSPSSDVYTLQNLYGSNIQSRINDYVLMSQVPAERDFPLSQPKQPSLRISPPKTTKYATWTTLATYPTTTRTTTHRTTTNRTTTNRTTTPGTTTTKTAVYHTTPKRDTTTSRRISTPPKERLPPRDPEDSRTPWLWICGVILCLVVILVVIYYLNGYNENIQADRSGRNRTTGERRNPRQVSLTSNV